MRDERRRAGAAGSTVPGPWRSAAGGFQGMGLKVGCALACRVSAMCVQPWPSSGTGSAVEPAATRSSTATAASVAPTGIAR